MNETLSPIHIWEEICPCCNTKAIMCYLSEKFRDNEPL